MAIRWIIALVEHPVAIATVTALRVLAFVMIWFRWTFPRFREDQLQSLAWKWLIPLALANIAVTAILKVVF